MTDQTQAAPESPAPANTKAIAIKAIDTGHGRMALMPTDFDQVWRIATLFSRSGEMVPKDFQGFPDKIATAIMWGMELGLTPINAVNSIAIIKGRASLWGDALLAVCIKHPDFVDCLEEPLTTTADGKTTVYGYRVTAKRNGRQDVVREFTIADAAKAGLIKRSSGDRGDGPWITYPERMCYMRARSWALRDQFPDALKGIASADEQRDVLEGEYSRVETPAPSAAPAARVPEAKPGIEHQANPLNNLSRVINATPEMNALHAAAENDERLAREYREQRGPIEPLETDPLKLAGGLPRDGVYPKRQAPIDFSDLETPSDLEHGKTPRSTTAPAEELQAGGIDCGELLPERKPLTPGQTKLLEIYSRDAAQYGVTEQDLIDHLGDSVHQGNLAAAQTWLETQITNRKRK